MSPRLGALRSRLASWMAPAAFVITLIGAWQLWCSIGDPQPWVLPAPVDVAQAGWAVRGALVSHATTTLVEAVMGLTLGSAFGVIVAVIIASAPVMRRALWPLVVTSQTIPVVALAPLFALWFGYDLAPKVALVALITFFPVSVSTVVGLTGVDQGHIDLIRAFGASRRQILTKVRVPAALPELFSGLRIAAAYAIGNAVVGEYIGGTNGLGIFIDRSRASYRTDQMLAGVAVISMLSIGLFSLVGFIGRRLTPWRSPETMIAPMKELA